MPYWCFTELKRKRYRKGDMHWLYHSDYPSKLRITTIASTEYAVLLYEIALKTIGGPSGVRTRAAALKGLCPGPLDDGTALGTSMVSREGLEPSTSGLKALGRQLSLHKLIK